MDFGDMARDTTLQTNTRAKVLSAYRAQRIGAAIVGTGYIADFHARAIRQTEGVELVSVCDVNLTNAQSFAAEWGVPAFDSLESMLQSGRVGSVHILAPPDHHYALAKAALQSGVHVLIEKPMCISVEQADELLAIASNKGLRLGVNHNMLYAGAYKRLRAIVKCLGPLDYVSINHFLELKQIRLGPFDSWMLRAPGNEFLEIGPHLVSCLLDLAGMPERIFTVADRMVNLPGGAKVFRRWHAHTTTGRISADININLGPGLSQRTIHVRGLLGSATVDFDANTCVLDQGSALGIDLDRYRRSQSLARQIRSQARQTFSDYVLSKLKLRHRGNPYLSTFLDSVAAFYSGLRPDSKIDSRIDGRFGRDVIECCSRIVRAAGVEPSAPSMPKHRRAPVVQPSVLVIGASGFIGRELVRQLLHANYGVRAMVRGSAGMLEALMSDHFEIVRGDMRSETDLIAATKGIQFVYQLVHVNGKTWEDDRRLNVEPARLIAKACLAAGVKRLLYISTIDPYYAGAKAGTITEETGLDRNIDRRNYYARAKAAIENILMEMHRTDGLPAVIFRPGIVIGQGGNPFHAGVGRWISEGVCEVWGYGNNKLPFVLVADVAAALVRGIQVAGIEGRSYNLVDVPLLTAREYLIELQRRSGVKLTLYYRPTWRFYATDLLKWLVKVAVRHPDATRVPSYRDWDSRTQMALFDCTRARAELNWVPASDRQRMFEEGIGGSLQSWLAACQ